LALATVVMSARKKAVVKVDITAAVKVAMLDVSTELNLVDQLECN
jgi:hypothetical protein